MRSLNGKLGPPKLGDLQFLYRKRSRLARIMIVTDYVNKRLEKDLKKFSSQYELVPSNSLRIVSFGKHLGNHSKFGIFPVGYVCERLYGDNKKACYRCEIQLDEETRKSWRTDQFGKRKLEFSVQKL